MIHRQAREPCATTTNSTMTSLDHELIEQTRKELGEAEDAICDGLDQFVESYVEHMRAKGQHMSIDEGVAYMREHLLWRIGQMFPVDKAA